MPRDPWSSLVAQLDVASVHAQERQHEARRRAARNPNPPGTIQPGSATDAVLAYLRTVRHQGRWLARCQVIIATGRSEKAVNWALLFLRAHGLVETASDDRRSGYLRYRARSEA